jgi:arginase
VIAQVVPASRVRQAGPAAIADAVLATVGAALLDGYWLHLDVDILDPVDMPGGGQPGTGRGWTGRS